MYYITGFCAFRKCIPLSLIIRGLGKKMIYIFFQNFQLSLGISYFLVTNNPDCGLFYKLYVENDKNN
jgi:hypothetical protein